LKVVIPGGAGQIGAVLSRHFVRRGDEVVVLSRSASAASAARCVPWDGRTLDSWAGEIDGADVVVNLAGRSVNCRYTEENLRQILSSRIDSTRVVGEAIAAARRAPRVWLQASAATIYAHDEGAAHGEADGRIGGSEPGVPGYWARMVDVAKQWEATLDAASVAATRRVALRTSIVLSPDAGGAFDVLLGLVRKGLGGPVGNGRQYVSWVTDNDFVRAVDWLIEHDSMSGAVNMTSPGPVTNAEFMRDLRHAWGAPIGLPAAGWMVSVGAWFMGTDPELVLKSRRVVPERLLSSGFRFLDPEWPVAATGLVRRWRSNSSSAGV
jgi:uncharacterized protein (TIGR01777 family)